MEIGEFTLRLLAALAAGMLVGIERQFQHKKAGLRTHSLVALGSALFVLIAQSVGEGLNFDPTRVLGQVVTGIGFLGAGVILHQGATVLGLTTAATIWCSAGLGCAAGFGYYKEAGIAALFIIFVNYVLQKLAEKIGIDV
jgi:putative Mg2+ transporter-C (MgtC) family protein